MHRSGGGQRFFNSKSTPATRSPPGDGGRSLQQKWSMTEPIETVRQHIACSYANLARAHSAVESGLHSYSRTHHMIRARLFKGLSTGTMSMRSLYDDEKVKLNAPKACCYCGATGALTIDHLIPKIKGGTDYADNLVWACQSCNSSKSDIDLMEWCKSKHTFPSLLLVRRYTKLVARYCEQHELLDALLIDVQQRNLPFRLDLLPYSFPALNSLVLWVQAIETEPQVAEGSEQNAEPELPMTGF